MYSGKTDALILRRAEIESSGVSTQIVKPAVDSRHAADRVVSHSGLSSSAITLERSADLLPASSGIEWIGVDEAQFFDGDLAEVISRLTGAGVDVFVAGLDYDFRGLPFQSMGPVIRDAERLHRLVAICGVCGTPATRTQRFEGNALARVDAPTVVIGGRELYEPRCPRCFVASGVDSLPPRRSASLP